mmetsp:Transcript_1378/g.2324  ORF Transcript_1378/g.2324 Transcript_1378/m.2324 type:complete len:619 (+) Transcript_1378:71-1927(+)|eukprot:CAMPEP_0197531594 /NCGR_PEP_ID=MMETSP1318-20131121/36363_1 /TAXON_ID=552666 /ORGANISM="Partenskyella glossopodia, Strain RCC365" /LENGTH=618 /DNA_ID=CAMNT_0043087879 /DNA_START=69 /DNA_END=1925 /DNA_ORIENTATION=+
MIHVRVEEARALLPMDNNGLSDPYCKFLFNKKKYRTKTVQKTLYPNWDTGFSISAKRSELKTKVLFKVFDEDFASQNDHIGEYAFDFGKLLEGPIAGWFDLKDKDGNADKPRGQIRVKITYTQSEDNLASSHSALAQQAFEELDMKEFKESKKEAKPLDIFVGTWNVGNAAPPSDLSAWIPKDKYTLYAIGSQECKYKEREGFDSCEKDWNATLAAHLGSNYVQLKAKSLGQMRLNLFAKKTEAKKFMDFKVASEATGIGHVIANKGGVAISLTYIDTSICFIAAHLAAHQHKTGRRNSDVQEIINGISKTMGKLKCDILCQFDHVIFMGDLNYRLDYGDQGEEKKPSKEQFDKMVQMINEGKYAELFAHDQLEAEKKKGNVFCGFTEGVYDFAPTFKVLRQAELAYTNQRSPSWCDRILWHSLTKEWILQKSLGAACEIATSDHKPVYTVLEVPTFSLPSVNDLQISAVTISLEQVRCLRLPRGTLDQNGLADPFLTVMGTFFQPVKSSVQKKNLNPVFDDVLEIKSAVTNLERLKYCMVVIKVADNNIAGLLNTTMGYTVLPVRWFLPESGQKSRMKMFRTRLIKGGVYVGSAIIQGTVKIQIHSEASLVIQEKRS